MLMQRIKSFIDSMMNSQSERVPYDENDDNGMIIASNYIPPEILFHIFIHYLDRESLLKCQLVCKRWNDFIQSYIWRKKADIVNDCNLPQDLMWTDYHLMYKNKPFKRNLIKNHSGENNFNGWEIVANGGNGWTVESPPVGIPPLPEDPVFGKTEHCFVTSYHDDVKKQIINLVEEGLPESILDNVKPVIEVSEWYGCRWDCSATYSLVVKLLDSSNQVVDSFSFEDNLRDEKQNVWLQKTHEFKNYNKDVRKIQFLHGGRDTLFWSGHYGSKMTRACVMVHFPKESVTKSSEDEGFNQEMKPQLQSKLKTV